jgi:hypothetical protein
VAGAGGEVLVTRPGYFNHESTLRMLGIDVGYVDVTETNRFVPVTSDVAAAIGPHTRALVLVTPNNPTGAVYPPELLEAIQAVCRDRGIWLILDETYRDFLHPDAGAPHALLAHPGWEENLIQLYSFSKAYCIPGHRLGAVVTGAAVQDELAKIMDNIQICAPRIAQRALAPLIDTLSDWRTGNALRMADRALAFEAALAGTPDWQITSLGGYFAYVRHPWPDRDGRDVAEALAQRAGILAIPGAFFGNGQSGYLRFAFANASREALATLTGRLAAFSA